MNYSVQQPLGIFSLIEIAQYVQSGRSAAPFGRRILELEELKKQIAQNWPQQSEYPLQATINLTRAVTDLLSKAAWHISALINDWRVYNFPSAMEAIERVVVDGIPAIGRNYRLELGTCISDAKYAGSRVAQCPRLRSASIAALDSLIYQYQTVFEIVQAIPLAIDNPITDFIVDLVRFIGETVIALGKGSIELVEKALPSFPVSDWVQLFKWASILGGLGMLWWVLKPEASKGRR